MQNVEKFGFVTVPQDSKQLKKSQKLRLSQLDVIPYF